MAGDWIKMELNTPDKPEIWAIALDLDIDPDAVTGKLFRLWAWFDQHSEKGNAPSVSKLLLDRLVSVNGFCNSVIKAGWMMEKEGILTLPNFDRHNGETGKKRSLTAKRVASHKAKTLINQKNNADSVSGALAKEEKRREEKILRDKEKIKKEKYELQSWVNHEAWKEFEQHRKEIKKPLTDLARTKAANALNGFSHEEQKSAIDNTIQNRWSGLFPKKLNGGQNEENKQSNRHQSKNERYWERTKARIAATS